jgi:hypothetical protein
MERYPIGERGAVRVDVRRTADTLSLALAVGSTTLLFAGEQGKDLGTRLRQADFALSLDPSRDWLVLSDAQVELVAAEIDEATLADGVLRLPRRDLAELAGLLERAHEAVASLRQAAEFVAH